MAFSEETYAVLNKKLASVTSGIATYEIVGNQLVMTTTDGQTLTYTFTQPKDGVGIDDISISGSGNTRTLTFTMTDGTTKTVDIPVVKGDKGDKGDGISTMQVVDNHLIVTLTDGTEIDCGLIDVTTSMANLEDVDVSTVENGQILIYDSTTNTWKNGSPSATSTSLDDLSNVNIDTITLQNGQIIKYDAVNQVWVNADSINIESLNDINDVNIVNIQDGQVIAYDSTNQKWVNTNAIAKLRDMTDVELTNLSELNMLRYDSVNNKWVNFDADTTVTDGSTNVVTSGAVYTELQNKSDKATTLSGYGITDSYTKTEEDTLLNAKADKSTTLDGYGITDAYTKTETDILLDGKVDKNGTDSLMTQAEHTKLEGIESGAEVNVQANWNQTDTEADNYIQNKPTLGTASKKNYTNYVSPTSSDLVISSSVYSAIDSAVSSVYEPYGNLTCAELTQDLLVQENVGHVYNITDSGTTTNLFIGGAGQTINPSDGVVIVRNGESFAYNLIGQLINLTAYQKKELDAPLEIGGTIQTNLESALDALNTEKADKATTLSGYGITNAYTKSETDTEITNAINDLDVTDEYVSNQFISSVSETNGKIDVTRQQLSTTPTLDVYTPISSHGVKKALNSEITPINDKIGNTSISTIGDGTITNAISELDSNLKNNTRTNLLNPTAQTQTINGVTFTNNGDGTYTANGTASQQAYILATSSPVDLIPFRNKDIRIAGCPSGGGANKYQYNLIISDASDTDITKVIDYGEGSTYYVPSNAHHAYVVIAVQNGYTANNLLFKPMLTTDLSATYNDFVQYSGDGELNENVAEIYTETNSAEDSLQNEGYRYPIINGVKNYTDSNGVYHKNLGVVDLGALNWGKSSSGNMYATVNGIVSSVYTVQRCKCDKYTYDTTNGNIDKTYWNSTTQIYIRDTTYTDATAFKNAMSGVLLFYELATPQTWNSKSEISRVSDETYTNLLNPTSQTKTVYGVTLTNNGDGTYTVNGTANGGNAAFNIEVPNNADISENTKLIGCPVGGTFQTYLLYISCYNGSTWVKEYDDYGNGVIISNIPAEVNSFKIYITIKNGTTCNNLLFKPMLTTKLDATYDDYIPYSGSGALNENVAEIKNDLSVIGNVYSASASNISIPASTDTLLLSNPNMPFGKYIAIGKVSLTGVQPDGGALFSMKTSDNGAYVREVSSINFIGNETIVGIVEFNEQNDFARLYYYSYNAVTVSSAEITLIKIS